MPSFPMIWEEKNYTYQWDEQHITTRILRIIWSNIWIQYCAKVSWLLYLKFPMFGGSRKSIKETSDLQKAPTSVTQ